MWINLSKSDFEDTGRRFREYIAEQNEIYKAIFCLCSKVNNIKKLRNSSSFDNNLFEENVNQAKQDALEGKQGNAFQTLEIMERELLRQ